MQSITQIFRRGDKSDALNEQMLNLEQRIENIKQTYHSIYKKLQSTLHATDADKRMKKISELSLCKCLADSVTLFNDDPLGSMLSLCNDGQSHLVRSLCQYEVDIENKVLNPIQLIVENRDSLIQNLQKTETLNLLFICVKFHTLFYTDTDLTDSLSVLLNYSHSRDIPNIMKLRKHFTKLHQQLEADKAKLNAASRQTLSNGNPTQTLKLDSLKEEAEESEKKLSLCKDQLETEMFIFVSHENELYRILLDLVKAQAAYHMNSYNNLQMLVPDMTKKLESSPRRPVFGCPLEEHLVYSKRSTGISVVIENCCQMLMQSAAQEEGLFRIASSASKVKKLKAAFDAELVDWSEYKTDPHCITGALKQYLRELPTPLLTFDLYQDWLKFAQYSSDDQLKYFASLLRKLPKANFDNLKYLIQFLRALSLNAGVNKMTPNNIAIVIAPNLLWSPNTDGQNYSLTGALAAIVEILIINSTVFFPGEFEIDTAIPPKRPPRGLRPRRKMVDATTSTDDLSEEQNVTKSSSSLRNKAVIRRTKTQTDKTNWYSKMENWGRSWPDRRKSLNIHNLFTPKLSRSLSNKEDDPAFSKKIFPGTKRTIRRDSKSRSADFLSESFNSTSDVLSETSDEQTPEILYSNNIKLSNQAPHALNSTPFSSETSNYCDIDASIIPNNGTFSISNTKSKRLESESDAIESSNIQTNHSNSNSTSTDARTSRLNAVNVRRAESLTRRRLFFSTPPPPPPREVHSDLYDTMFTLHTLNHRGSMCGRYASKVRSMWDQHLESTTPALHSSDFKSQEVDVDTNLGAKRDKSNENSGEIKTFNNSKTRESLEVDSDTNRFAKLNSHCSKNSEEILDEVNNSSEFVLADDPFIHQVQKIRNVNGDSSEKQIMDDRHIGINSSTSQVDSVDKGDSRSIDGNKAPDYVTSTPVFTKRPNKRPPPPTPPAIDRYIPPSDGAIVTTGGPGLLSVPAEKFTSVEAVIHAHDTGSGTLSDVTREVTNASRSSSVNSVISMEDSQTSNPQTTVHQSYPDNHDSLPDVVKPVPVPRKAPPPPSDKDKHTEASQRPSPAPRSSITSQEDITSQTAVSKDPAQFSAKQALVSNILQKPRPNTMLTRPAQYAAEEGSGQPSYAQSSSRDDVVDSDHHQPIDSKSAKSGIETEEIKTLPHMVVVDVDINSPLDSEEKLKRPSRPTKPTRPPSRAVNLMNAAEASGVIAEEKGENLEKQEKSKSTNQGSGENAVMSSREVLLDPAARSKNVAPTQIVNINIDEKPAKVTEEKVVVNTAASKPDQATKKEEKSKSDEEIKNAEKKMQTSEHKDDVTGQGHTEDKSKPTKPPPPNLTKLSSNSPQTEAKQVIVEEEDDSEDTKL